MERNEVSYQTKNAPQVTSWRIC